MQKRKNEQGMNVGQIITLAAATGTANAVALQDVPLGFGISMMIFVPVLAIQFWKTNYKKGL
ncbi:MAG: hypothetical protein AAF846_00220 [Chloroflexota bacterium]